MIDFTILQANPIPPNIAELQEANTNLKNKNKGFKIALFILSASGVVLFGINKYKINKKLCTNTKKK